MQAVEDLGHRQRPQPRGRQLNGERHTIEPRADLGHNCSIIVGDGEVRLDSAGAVFEQFNGLAAQRQRRHPPGHLTGQSDRLSAGRHQRQAWARSQKCVDEFRARVEQMLTVIEHHQRLTAADGSNDGVHRRSARLVRKPERAGNGDSYEFDVGDRREVDVPHLVAELVRDPNRQSRLSRTTRSGEGYQSVVGQQPTHVGDLSFTANETRQLRWKTLGRLRFRCSQRRKVIANVRMAQLHNPFRPGQVAQRMSAEIIQPRIRRVGDRAPLTPLHPTAASGHRGPNPEAGRCG